MKPIFNSLGSNYSFGFAVTALSQIFSSKKSDYEVLQKKLEEKFGGECFLFYKGRDAIEFALRALHLETGAQVLTQAFTCHAIEEAIVRAGAEPVYVDLAQDAFNPSVEALHAAFENCDRTKVVLIQHTLGNAAEIKKIRHWCNEHHLILIEDLAQSFGGKDGESAELGTEADIVICSFGRDKVIDAVSGGAVIFKKYIEIVEQLKLPLPSRAIVFRDMCYPFLTWCIRNTHAIEIGKILFRGAKLFGFLTSPIESPTKTMTNMPSQYATLALLQLKTLDEQLTHRQLIARTYAQYFPAEHLEANVALRFPIGVKHPDSLAQKLAKEKIYLSDRWYREAVDSGSLHLTSRYVAGSCPAAETLAKYIFNLPTHLGISVQDAQRIAVTVKKILKEDL